MPCLLTRGYSCSGITTRGTHGHTISWRLITSSTGGYDCNLVGGLGHFFPYIGNVIIPIDFHIFQRGRSTTNQVPHGSFGPPKPKRSQLFLSGSIGPSWTQRLRDVRVFSLDQLVENMAMQGIYYVRYDSGIEVDKDTIEYHFWCPIIPLSLILVRCSGIEVEKDTIEYHW